MRHPALRKTPPALAAMALALLQTGCWDSDDRAVNATLGFLGTVTITTYDGSTDDLLTAGLGKSGLANAAAATYADALAPTAAELRRAAIHNKYRGIVDTTAAGGFGTLYGPNVAADGTVTAGEGKVAGTEYVAFSDDGTGRQNVVLVVQVPGSFDPSRPCIVSATSSGSSNVYGGISTGEWGLKRGCAVAYTDKGTGTAPHDLGTDTVPLINGTRATAALATGAAAGLAPPPGAQFRANLSTAELASVNAATPHRLAFKHAHSERNPEKDWGTFTLQAIQFAFWALNEQFAELNGLGQRLARFEPGNTLVIASSVSNGGGAALAAAEQDTAGLIDAVAVAEPAVEMPANANVQVQRGAALQTTVAKPLVDFTTYAHLYSTCAALAPELAGTPFQATYANAAVFGFVATNRCAALKAQGLLTATTTATQASEALQKLRDYGWEAEAVSQLATMAGFEVAPAVAVTFANALSRASVKDHLCGFSFAATQAPTAGLQVPAAVSAAALATMYVTGNGVPPSATVNLVNNASVGGAVRDVATLSPTSGLYDLNLDGALCLRNLVTGSDAAAQRLQAGLNETRHNGNLRGKPTVIVHGRADPLLPVNHTSRPYTVLNKQVEGAASKLSYIEVTHAQHFDSFIGLPTVLPGYDSRFVPLHVYLNRALDAVYAHLTAGTPLPPSQVVRTVPRGGTAGAAPAIGASNVPAIAAQPGAADAITVSGNTLLVPD